ncbi:MAG: aminotransferase class IV [Candidatus Delongbacteria bacterium]|nr:aminotransferase class IV [Candidatus Delongbacteria bacterium]
MINLKLSNDKITACDELGYKDGPFETVLAFKKNILYLSTHIARFKSALNFTNQKVEYNFKNFQEIEKFLTPEFSVVRFSYFDEQSIYVTIKSYSSPFPEKYLKLKSFEVKNDLTIANQCKLWPRDFYESLSFKAINNKFDDALIVSNSIIKEISIANIFFVKEDTFYTPNEKFILNGVVRNKVIDLLKDLEVKIIIDDIHLKDISNFDSCFVTNSLRMIQFVKQIDDVIFENKNQKLQKLRYTFDPQIMNKSQRHTQT